jgi:excisionase family DNA binding protein
MSTSKPLASRLEDVANRLRQRGDHELVDQLSGLALEVDALEQRVSRAEPADSEMPSTVMTTGEAARTLGIRSVNTIKRWAREGLLAGFQRGGRVMVSRESVEALLASPTLSEQREYEHRLAEAFDAIDPGDEPLPPSGMAHVGRKPWEHVAAARD